MKKLLLRDLTVWFVFVALCTLYQVSGSLAHSRPLPMEWYGRSIISAMILGGLWLLFRDLTLRISLKVGWLSLTILLSLLAPVAAYAVAYLIVRYVRIDPGSRLIVFYPLLIAGAIWGPLSAIIRFHAAAHGSIKPAPEN